MPVYAVQTHTGQHGTAELRFAHVVSLPHAIECNTLVKIQEVTDPGSDSRVTAWLAAWDNPYDKWVKRPPNRAPQKRRPAGRKLQHS